MLKLSPVTGNTGLTDLASTIEYGPRSSLPINESSCRQLKRGVINAKGSVERTSQDIERPI
jgi:hypothetical protein